jgi:hypothetical protein
VADICTTCRNDKKLCILPVYFLYVYRMNLSVNGELFPTQRWPTYFADGKTVCSLWGTGSSLLMKNRVFWDMRRSRLVNSLELREIAAFTFGVFTRTALKMAARYLACPVCTLYQLFYPVSSKQRRDSETMDLSKSKRRKKIGNRRRYGIAHSDQTGFLCLMYCAEGPPSRCGRIVSPQSAQCHSWHADCIAQRQSEEPSNIVLYWLLLRACAWCASSQEFIRLRL